MALKTRLLTDLQEAIPRQSATAPHWMTRSARRTF